MKIREIMETASAGTSCAGGVAPVAMPMGIQSRSGGSLLTGKYTTSSDPTPNTPKEYKRNKHARGQFKNSISN
jgi:hypothetical protein